MESYCEVTVLFSSLVYLLVWNLASIMTQRTGNRRLMYLLCWIPSATACIQPSATVCVLSEMMCLLLIYGFGFEAVLLSAGLRLSLCLALLKLFGGSFVQLQLFVPSDKLWWIPAAMVMAGLNFLIVTTGQGLFLTRYLYPVVLEIQGCKKRMSGYLDSGNMLQYRGRPVIFVKEKLTGKIQTGRLKTVSGESDFFVVEGKVKLAGKWKTVWIAQDEGIKDCGFDVLLNVTLLQEEKE